MKLRIFAPIGAALVAATLVVAQNPGIQRNIVTRQDVSKPNYEAVVASVTISPGASAGRHTHPGEEMTLILESEVEVFVDGQPTKRLKAGEGFIIPNGAKHDVHNVGTGPAKLAAVYYVEKGKPLATPTP